MGKIDEKLTEEMTMMIMSPEKQQELDEHILGISRILYEHTEVENLKTFEGIEWELRKQVLEKVTPQIGEFFFSEGGEKRSGKQRSVKTCLGLVEISQKQGKKLGLRSKTQISPGLEKCCLRLCAKNSYEQAENDLKTLMGISIGGSSLHRLVQKIELPAGQGETQVSALSVDGGKIRLRSEETGKGEWRDYKAVSLHESICEAFFQEPVALERWSEQQSLSPILTCLGDGHDGVWNVIKTIGGSKVVIQRQVLDWYHLKENLYKVGGSLKRLQQVETMLWLGWVDAAIAEFDCLRGKQPKKFQLYLDKHRQRIPNYSTYQKLGIPIGSGSVESKIKQIGARVKISGALWKRENVSQILRLRCAYLNNSSCLSIYA